MMSKKMSLHLLQPEKLLRRTPLLKADVAPASADPAKAKRRRLLPVTKPL